MPDPNHFSSIGWIIVALAALCLACNQIDDFIKRRQGKDGERTVGPQPFEVKQATEYVHKHEFTEHAKHNTNTHNAMFTALRVSEEKQAKTVKQDVAALQLKIAEVAEQNAAQEAKQDLMNQRLVQMDAKIDRLIERKA